MRPAYRPASSPQPPPYRTQILEHLGRVAGLCDELGLGEVLDQAPRQNPARRDLTVGAAVKAMVLNGLGLINHARSLVPRLFPNTPTSRLMAPRVPPKPLHDDALGRALAPLSDAGVTELYSLMAATAAQRLGLASRFVHLDRTRVQGDGRANSDEAPEEHVIHITRGDSRDQRPALNHVMLDVSVEHQAGMPGRMPPRSGHSRDVQDFGQLIPDPLAPWQLPYGPTVLGAARALSSAENLQKLAAPQTPWITRVPATLSAAQAVLAQADPQTMAPLTAGDRSHVGRSRYGGVAQRWGLRHSEPRQPQAQRTGAQQLLPHSEPAVKACTRWCRTPFAGAAAAQQALATLAQGVPATFVAQRPIRPIPRDAKRGRPGHGTPPEQIVYQLEGALAMQIATRQAHIAQPRGFILATNALDATRVSPPALCAGYQGQAQAERGFRCLKDPQFLAASRDLKTPERISALLMVMTICLLVYAALESRRRTALKEHEATFPDPQGKRIQNPTARWVFHDVVGIHVCDLPRPWPIVRTLTEAPPHRLHLLGKRYPWVYR